MKKLILLLIISGFSSQMSYAVTRYSTGGAVGAEFDWNDAASWNTNSDGVSGSSGVPVAGDDVEIRSTHVIAIAPGASGVCRDLTMRDGGILELAGLVTSPAPLAGATLAVSGDLNLYSNTDPYSPVILGNGAKLQLLGTSLASIAIDGKEMRIIGNLGILEIGSTSITADYEIFDNAIVPGSGTLALYCILAPIKGNLETNGILTLKAATPTEYARVAINDGTAIVGRQPYNGTISGSLTMEHHFTGTNLIASDSLPNNNEYEGKWFQMSYPLTPANTADVTSGWSGMTINNTNPFNAQFHNIWRWDATATTNTNPDYPGFFEAVGWTFPATTNVHKDPYTIFLTSNAPFQASPVISLTGTAELAEINMTSLIDGKVTLDPSPPTTYPGIPAGLGNGPIGWVLLRNPWPSIIDTENWMSSVPGGGQQSLDWIVEYRVIHVWNTGGDANNNSLVKGGHYEGFTVDDPISPGYSFVDYNTSGGVATGAAGQGGSGPLGGEYNIAPFQAFWVKTDLATQTEINGGSEFWLRKKYSETTYGAEVFHKTSGNLPETAALFVFNQDSLGDITLIYYNDPAVVTNQFDKRGDMYKLMSLEPGVPNLFIEEGGNLAQSAGRPFKAVDTVDVFYTSTRNNNQTAYLWLNDTNLSSTYSVMLYDKLTQQTQDMRATPTYQFVHNTNNNADRFQLIITNSAFDIAESSPSVKPMTVYMAGDDLVIESNDYTGPAYFTLFDMAGRAVMMREIELTAGVSNYVQMPGLSTALYSAEIDFDGHVMVEKIMK